MSRDENVSNLETANAFTPHRSMECLTESQQGRLADLLETYLETLEEGKPCDVNLLAANDPDLVQPLAGYVKSLQFMHAAVQASPILMNGSTDSVGTGPRQERGAKQLGDYQLLRELGRGEMGVVYEAMQVSLGRHVACTITVCNILTGNL